MQLSGNNLTVKPLTAPTGSDFRRKLAFPFWLLANGAKLLREVWRADAVHTPIPGDIGTIGMLLAFVLGKPLFVRYCGNWRVQATMAERFWRWFMESAAGGKTICLATGAGDAPPSSRNPALKWIFATTLTTSEIESCATTRERHPGRSPRLIIACRQEPEKGADVVIRSLPLLLAEFPGLAFDVAGNGSVMPDLKRLAASLGVSDRVTFHGQVNHGEVIRLLQQADLFCFPTTSSEGFPKAVIEAMACGLPVITTKVSALPHLVGADCGVLLDEAKPEALAEAVRRCLADEERYRSMSQQAAMAARQYSLENWRDTIGRELRAGWGKLRADD